MPATIDQQFIEYIVKSLVGKPDAVKLERRIDEKGVLLELTVDPEDLGRVIGKRGATAQSLRTLLRALGTKNDARYNLKIIDNGFPPPRHRDDESQAVADQPISDDAPVDDQTVADEPETEAEAPVEEETPAEEEAPAETPAEVSEEGEPEDVGRATNDDSSDHESGRQTLAERTRAELADLDDLDL